MRLKIRLDTTKDIENFVEIATKVDGPVTITDGNGLRVNAKSFMGVAYSRAELTELWCESEKEIYHLIKDYISGDSTAN